MSIQVRVILTSGLREHFKEGVKGTFSPYSTFAENCFKFTNLFLDLCNKTLLSSNYSK